jgi:hypothetical protein
MTATMALMNSQIGNRAVRGDAFGRVFVIFAAETHDDVRDGFAEGVVGGFVARFEREQFFHAFFFELRGFVAQALGFRVIKRAHVGFGDGSGRAQHRSSRRNRRRRRRRRRALRNCGAPSSDCARPLRANPRATRRCKGRGISGCVGQQAREDLRGGQMRVEFFGFARHAQGIVIAANLHAFAAAFAKVGNENREQAARAGRFLFDASGKSRERCYKRAAACR